MYLFYINAFAEPRNGNKNKNEEKKAGNQTATGTNQKNGPTSVGNQPQTGTGK